MPLSLNTTLKEKYEPSFPKKSYLATASISGQFYIFLWCNYTVSHLAIFLSPSALKEGTI